MSEPRTPSAAATAGRVVSAILAALSAGWLAWAVVAYSNVDHDFVTIQWFLLWGAGAILAIHTVTAVILLGISARSSPHGWWWAAGLSAPMALLCWYGLVSAGVPFWVRFELSQGELESFAGSVSAGERSLGDGAMRVGLFKVSEYDEVDGCVRMITTKVFLDDAGLVFCPEGRRPTVVGEDYYEHLGGRWWSWHRSW